MIKTMKITLMHLRVNYKCVSTKKSFIYYVFLEIPQVCYRWRFLANDSKLWRDRIAALGEPVYLSTYNNFKSSCGTPLHKLHRYVEPQRVWFLSHFFFKNGYTALDEPVYLSTYNNFKNSCGIPLHKLHRYVEPQRVWFLSHFFLKNRYTFSHFGLKV